MAKVLFGSLPKTDVVDSENRDYSGSSTQFTVSAHPTDHVAKVPLLFELTALLIYSSY